MKIAICEDEKIYSDKLHKAVTDYFNNRDIKAEISIFADSAPLISAYSHGEKFELILFDIQLENSDGMNAAAEIRKLDDSAVFIFVTSIENRAVEGYSVSAFDYIVKSSLDDRLYAVLDRFMEMVESSYITVHNGSEVSMVDCNNIIYIESDGRGTAIHTSEGVINSTLPVGKTAELLPSGRFTEIHKSIFVQTTKIKRIGSDTVEMLTGEILPLSRRKRKQTLTAVMTAVKGGLK